MTGANIMPMDIMGQPRPRAPTTEPDRAEAREPSSEMKRRLTEWQREREAVSRQIQLASPGQVIIINSDVNNTPQASNGVKVASKLDEQQSPEADDYEDIWQLEARDYENRLNKSSLAAQPEGTSSKRRSQNSMPNAPDRSVDVDSNGNLENVPPSLWHVRHRETPFAGKSRLRQLKEEQIDLAALLNVEETPNTKSYYRSSPHTPFTHNNTRAPSEVPVSNARRESVAPNQLSSTNLSQLAREVDFREPNIQSSEVVYISSLSPPAATSEEESHDVSENAINEERHPHDRLRGYEEDPSPPVPPENASNPENPVTIPNLLQQSKREPSTSWLRRLTDITPGWLLKTDTTSVKGSGSLAEQEQPDNLRKQLSSIQEAPQVIKEGFHYSRTPQLPFKHGLNSTGRQPKTPLQTRALAASGYFTDDHYAALRRLYRLAKRSPNLFPYYPTPRREGMMGDWLWTADSVHGVPVTEIHFGILDTFMQELSESDRRYGGAGEIGWTEDDLHKRLFSIIVGEQIRRERKLGAATRERSGRR
jgi:hypothetical protein